MIPSTSQNWSAYWLVYESLGTCSSFYTDCLSNIVIATPMNRLAGRLVVKLCNRQWRSTCAIWRPTTGDWAPAETLTVNGLETNVVPKKSGGCSARRGPSMEQKWPVETEFCRASLGEAQAMAFSVTSGAVLTVVLASPSERGGRTRISAKSADCSARNPWCRSNSRTARKIPIILLRTLEPSKNSENRTPPVWRTRWPICSRYVEIGVSS